MINEWVNEGEIQTYLNTYFGECIICVKSTVLMGEHDSLVMLPRMRWNWNNYGAVVFDKQI